MRYVTPVVVTSLFACALGSLVSAQSQPGAPGPDGFAPAGVPGGAAQSAPTARVNLSLTFAGPDMMPSGNNEVFRAIAYLATDPELRKQPGFRVPEVGLFDGGMMGMSDPGVQFAAVGVGQSVYVDKYTESPGRIDVQLAAGGVEKKDLLQTVARRVVEGLAPSKLPREQREKRLREINEQITSIEDKKQLLSTVAANTVKLGPEILKDRIKAAELERQRLEMDLAAQRVRSDAIAREIDRIRAQSEEKLQSDAVLKQLRDVVKLREEQRDRVKQLHETGSSSQSDLAQADEQIMNANIRVTEREETIRQSTNASLLERLNAELASNMINRAEMEVRLELIRRHQPSIDVKDLDEEKLNRLTDEYRALFRSPGTLPPLYFELEKRQAELGVQRLALLVSEAKAGEVTVTTQPAP